MTYLSCGVNNCASNKENCCCRSDIKVKGSSARTTDGTRCASFCEQGGFMASIVPSDFAELETEVKCEVENCVYYEHGNCCAASINIDGTSAQDSIDTCCGTFRKK